MRGARATGRLAVAVHDVEPRSFERVKTIRAWLAARGVERVTLLVIPASDLHPIGARGPGLASWLREREALGDAIAQHGLAHRRSVRAPWPRSTLAHWQGGPAAEFPGLGSEEAAQRVDCGRRLLLGLGLDPRGFVAPGYAYTRVLRPILAERFEWFADLQSVRGRDERRLRASALCLGTSTPLKRRLSPLLVGAGGRRAGELMRLDVHPEDFRLSGHIATINALLQRARGREIVTYDQLLG